MNELVYWIWLSLCCKPDTATFPSLLKKFNSAKEIFEATDKEISGALDPRSSDRNLLLQRDLTRAEEILEFCTKRGVGILPYSDESYPELLRKIPTPPVLLYYRGTLPDFKRRAAIAVVGTRTLTEYGKRNAFSISYNLAQAGAIIVSGMAIGIDGVAHAGAIAAEAPTVAVLGSGIDVCYPPVHLTLARNIVKNGCIFSEYAPGTQPTRYSFPQRNRIISGLSEATVVIEAGERSGAMITATHARKQERLLYALPGMVGEKNAAGSNLLLMNGAKTLTWAMDLIPDFSDIRKRPCLNPGKIEPKIPVHMENTLTELKISCVTPTDDIFYPPRPKRSEKGAKAADKENRAKREAAEKEKPKEAEAVPVLNDKEAETAFTKEVFAIYKKIPTVGDCTIESLADNEHDLRAVMKSILKLEMARFVTLLPGERVMRKLK